MNLLENIDSPADVRKLSRHQLTPLAHELRTYLLDSVSKTGGHLSSNLGTVELTVALHYVFNTPQDRIVWDVGTRPIRTKSSPAGASACIRCASWTASPASRAASKANTTPSARPTRRPRFRPRWAWRRRPRSRVNTTTRSPSSATAP